MHLKPFDSSLTKAVPYIFKASFFTAICTSWHRQFKDTSETPEVKNTTFYVGNSSHTLSPVCTIHTHNNHIQCWFFSKNFFNEISLDNIVTGQIAKSLLTLINMLIDDEFILKPTKYFRPRDIEFKWILTRHWEIRNSWHKPWHKRRAYSMKYINEQKGFTSKTAKKASSKWKGLGR